MRNSNLTTVVFLVIVKVFCDLPAYRMSKSEVLLFVHVYKYNDAHLSANAGII
jgi:hypothetical protein